RGDRGLRGAAHLPRPQGPARRGLPGLRLAGRGPGVFGPRDGRVTSATMLTISRDLYEKIIEHARKDHPDEACGVIAGRAGSARPRRFIPMQNAERSPTFYRFDSLEQLRVWREMDDNDEEAVVIYHSHTATQAYPSRTDISYASEPQAHYVLVS